jgi:pyruvate,water dikinase
MAPDRSGESLGPGAPASEAARSLFSKFRALLEANTAALATMAAMERMLGGEYIFDRAFLEKSAREVADYTHQAVYAVNAMTGNRHVALYDRFMAIAAAVEDILAGRQGADDDRLVRSLGRLRLEDRSKVGTEGAALGELFGQLGLAVPAGLVLARAAWDQAGLTPPARQAVAAALDASGSDLATETLTVAVALDTPQGLAARREIRAVPARAEAVLAALDQAAAAARAEAGQADERSPFCAAILAVPPAVLRCRLWTRWSEQGGLAGLRLDVWTEADPETRDTFFLERSHPFAVRRSILAAKPMDGRLPDGLTPLATDAAGFLRGSVLLPFETAAALAGQAMAAERLLGAPLELAVALETRGRPVFESVRLLPEESPQAPQRPPLGAVLLDGGQAACLGAASGVVMVVDETTSPIEFPFGAVAVARSASPGLAPLLRRAGAMVAQVGDTAGHLAAVAREYRVPALFGLAGALDVLRPGLVVTVDADAGRVHAGASENRPVSDTGLSPDDPEYLTLRRLLRRVAILNLTDPQAREFSAAGCRTLHDILHFAHDQAVGVLTDLRQAGVSEHLARILPLPVPLDLRVLDIGGGLAPGASGLAGVRSRPLAVLLSGLLTPGMWDTTPAKVGLGDLFEAMAKASPATGGNLAIAARSYCNVSLRLGYHFTVIDAYLDQNPEKNTIYFRFVGGLANAAGREARAFFLRQVLARYDFKVETAGDLVVARLKLVEPETAEAALRLLGCLCAFARQRDTGLANEGDAAALERKFRQALARAAADGEGAA